MIGWNLRSRRVGLVGRRVTKNDQATIVDLSVWGARIIAPTDPSLDPGSLVAIRADGMTGRVRIRWIGPASEPGTSTYGVEFVEIGADLESWLCQPIRDLRHDVSEVGWAGSPRNPG